MQRIKRKGFGIIEVMLLVISLVTFVLDMTTDGLVSVEYFYQGHVLWGIITLVLVIVPTIIIQVFSARWYLADEKPHSISCWCTHLLCLQPLERYVGAIVAGIESKSSRKEEALDAYYYKLNDVCMLRLFEAFLESAPQLCLQVYVILCTDSWSWLTVTSACVSLGAIGIAVAAYSHALRQAYRESYRVIWPGLALQTLWHMCMAASRVLALVLFASVFGPWVFLVLGVHWIFMVIWVMVQKTDFCPSIWEERLFNIIVAIIYCFAFFNVKEGRTRYRIATFYCVMFVENGSMLGVWLYFHDPHVWYATWTLATVPATFVIGLLCMLLYYRCCHPSTHQPPPVVAVDPGVCTTPMLPRKFSQPPPQAQAPDPLPPLPPTRTTSAATLGPGAGRRGLLKNHSSRLQPGTRQLQQQQVFYHEVATPSQLSPIKAFLSPYPELPRRLLTTDSTPQMMGDMSGFQHYSINQSACLDSIQAPPSAPSTPSSSPSPSRTSSASSLSDEDDRPCLSLDKISGIDLSLEVGGLLDDSLDTIDSDGPVRMFDRWDERMRASWGGSLPRRTDLSTATMSRLDALRPPTTATTLPPPRRALSCRYSQPPVAGNNSNSNNNTTHCTPPPRRERIVYVERDLEEDETSSTQQSVSPQSQKTSGYGTQSDNCLDDSPPHQSPIAAAQSDNCLETPGADHHTVTITSAPHSVSSPALTSKATSRSLLAAKYLERFPFSRKSSSSNTVKDKMPKSVHSASFLNAIFSLDSAPKSSNNNISGLRGQAYIVDCCPKCGKNSQAMTNSGSLTCECTPIADQNSGQLDGDGGMFYDPSVSSIQWADASDVETAYSSGAEEENIHSVNQMYLTAGRGGKIVITDTEL